MKGFINNRILENLLLDALIVASFAKGVDMSDIQNLFSGGDPIEIFVRAIIYTIGQKISQEMVKSLEPIAKNALDQLKKKLSNIDINRNLHPDVWIRPNSVEPESKPTDIGIMLEDSSTIVNRLLSLSNNERKRIIDLAYKMADNNHEKAMYYLLVLVSAKKH